MLIHFSSVHPLIKTFNNDEVKMRFVKLLRKLILSINNDPSCIRPVEGLIRTVRAVWAMPEG
jgi:hypothetical protein